MYPFPQFYTKRLWVLFFLSFFFFVGCDDDDGGTTPPPPPPNEPGEITRNQMTIDDTFTGTRDTLSGSGSVTFELSCTSFAFEVRNGDLIFGSDNVFKGISGEIRPKSQENCFLVGLPSEPDAFLRADLFFHSGAFIQETYDVEFQLDPEKDYFILGVRSDIGLGLCKPGSTGAEESLTLNANLGQILYLMDPCDPLIYLDARSDLIGGLAFGLSLNGNLTYIPDYPVDNNISELGGRALRWGSFSFKDFFEFEGVYIENQEITAELSKNNFLESDINIERSGGFNGSISVGVPLISLPIGAGSAAFQLKGGTIENEVNIFLRGIVDPISSWWPDVIPIEPIQQEEIRGSFTSVGNRFELFWSNKFGLLLPSGPSVISGENSLESVAEINNDSLLIARNVVLNDQLWGAEFLVEKEETQISATVPEDLLTNWVSTVTNNLSGKLDEFQEICINYEEAFEGYQLALGLDGLRAQIPGITARVRSAIDGYLNEAKNRAIALIPSNVCSGGLFCNRAHLRTQICDWIDDIGDSYKADLDRMDAAVADEVDNETTRAELEAALRRLISRDVLRGSRTFSFCVQAGACVNAPNTITVNLANFNIRIYSDEELAQLNRAADLVSEIPDAYDKFLDAEAIFLPIQPKKDRISGLINDIQNGLETPPSINKLGFVKIHETGQFSFFFQSPTGERVLVEREFDPFDPDSFLDAFYDL